MKSVIALAFDYRRAPPRAPQPHLLQRHPLWEHQQINDDGSGRTTIVESEPRLRFLPRSRGGRVGPDSGQGCVSWLALPGSNSTAAPLASLTNSQ